MNKFVAHVINEHKKMIDVLFGQASFSSARNLNLNSLAISIQTLVVGRTCLHMQDVASTLQILANRNKASLSLYCNQGSLLSHFCSCGFCGLI